MSVFRISPWCIAAATLCLCAPFGLNQANAFQRGPPDAAEGVEVLTRGPVHEAFAETITFDPQPGVVTPKAPPDAIEELPPDQRPDGANVAWIPGYWGWDDERNDFLWVSGIWRSLPPGRQWVPGYWARSGLGAQWTSGYWADARLTEVEYLPEPPATVEVGPNIAAPSADHYWLPGNWQWQQNRYAWRPGYWTPGQSNWDWIPSHYVWTPRGYVYVNGYYDYSVARRGVLYAPVYINSGVYARRGFSYSPVTVINPLVFGSHLFLRPSYGHYYYGDYYAANYTTAGYSPWFSYHSSQRGYDPFYAQQRWQNRQNADWAQTVQTDYRNRRDHEDARPPRTWVAQQELGTRGTKGSQQSLVVAASLADLAKVQETPLRFQPLATEERQQIGKRGQEYRAAREERQTLEAVVADPSVAAPLGPAKPFKAKLPKTPLAVQPPERFGKDHVPPVVQETPDLDPKVEPKPRTPRGVVEPPKVNPLEPKPVPKVGPNPIPGTQPKPVPKVEPKPVPGVEPRPTPRVEPKPVPRVEPKPAPKVEPKPAPRVEPKPAPKVEPRPVPKVEPKPAPRVEPKPAPRVEPRPAPRVEPKPVPRVEPKPAPKVEPKPAPKVEPKPEPKGKGKEKDKPKK